MMSETNTPPKLCVVIGTYNRLDQLQACLNSLIGKIRVPHQIVVIDAGSTDGTLDYLQQLQGIRLVCDGQKLGQARSYNRVFKTVEADYTCWLSDDNIAVEGMLDLAVCILDEHSQIGMVALKTKDMLGPFQKEAYIGGISAAGILNCNQGMMRTQVLREVGYFSESFTDYGIDVDLTTRFLLAGWQVVYTKAVAIYHHREWMDHTESADYQRRMERQKRSIQLYLEKYGHLNKFSLFFMLKRSFFGAIRLFDKIVPSMLFRMAVVMGRARTLVYSSSSQADFRSRLKYGIAWGIVRLEALFLGELVGWLRRSFGDLAGSQNGRLRDWRNVLTSRYISFWDLYINRDKPFYLVQSMQQQ
jgi:GT2 family glycosyltransferase